MPEEPVAIPIGESNAVTAIRTQAEGVPRNLRFVYAPGAGSGLTDPFGVFISENLARYGIETWRFQFPYKENGRRVPDPSPVLQGTWRAVVKTVEAAGNRPIVIGGRSMGGRIASAVVASGDVDVAGLVLLAYPLLPPGRDGTGRVEYFPRISVPALFCSGTRDSFATPQQLIQAASLVPDATVHLLEGADHGFTTLKASSRTRDDVYLEALEAMLAFFDKLAV